MRRIWLLAAIAVGIVGLLWLAEEEDLGHLAGIDGQRTAARPSWGDVADKVGEFANAETELKRAIGTTEASGGEDAPPQPP